MFRSPSSSTWRQYVIGECLSSESYKIPVFSRLQSVLRVRQQLAVCGFGPELVLLTSTGVRHGSQQCGGC